ncbi:hypothetical protein ACFRKB_28540 [Streptomyces scopuliridis]|uniref:hypothetical protein n=1 Tax=Streptomyces scopuliridis TaxID=452529 RepID=UPI0036A936C4
MIPEQQPRRVVPGTPQTPQPPSSQPAPSPAASPWASAPARPKERVTSRLRKVVEGLPEWEPLPPGEMTVRRPKKDL